MGEGERRGGEGKGDPDLILRHATKETTKCVEMSLLADFTRLGVILIVLFVFTS